MKFRWITAMMLLWAGNALAAGLMIEDPWIREAPPTAQALGGFMVVHNHADKARVLVAAESPQFGSVMLHRTVMADGMAKMIHQPQIEIPAGGSLAFEPGSYHLMLMKPKAALSAGDKVPVTVKFADGETMDITFVVRAGAGMGMNHGNMGGSMHMGH